MLKRFNWRLVFGVILVAGGFITLLTDGGSWVYAGYVILFGIGLLIAYYADKYPQRVRGPLAWTLLIIWGVAMIGFMIVSSNPA